MNFIVEYGKVLPFDLLQPRSIALDGYVEGPEIDPVNRRFSFDHHGRTPRLAMSATCRQVYDAIVLGLDATGYTICLNGIDADGVLSAWMLRHSALLRSKDNQIKLQLLVDVIAEGDAHGPGYPLRDEALASTFHSMVLEPRRRMMLSAGNQVWTNVLLECISVMDAWWESGLVPMEVPILPDPDFRIEEHGTWVAVFTERQDPRLHVRITKSIYSLGFDRMLIATPLDDHIHTKYSIAKRSDLVEGFDIPAMYASFNALEGGIPAETWGGGTTAGASPRGKGSTLDVQTVISIVSNHTKRSIQ